MRYRLASATDVGRVRSGNEDSVGAAQRDDGDAALLIVADGMGGAAAGEVASSSAVAAVEDAFAQGALPDTEQLAAWIRAANDLVLAKSRADASMEGMGTTITALYLRGVSGTLMQVGDSRAYRIRPGSIERLTEDQSAWSDTVRQGGSPAAEYGRNHLTNALGLDGDLEVTPVGPFPLQVGDRFLVCSDGLWGYVTDPEILRLASECDLEVWCRRLIDLANARGGADNITIAAADVLDD